jgi:DNA-binding transcriptional LysR family regulator
MASFAIPRMGRGRPAGKVGAGGMDLHKLRVFVAVAREGNVTRAAKQLSLSQPALSKQLSELEDALSTVLFDRLPRGMRLTTAGEALLRHAERIFAAERAAESEIAELNGLRAGRLSIGASTTIGSYLIPSVFGAFQRAHREVRLELEIANTAAIQALVSDGRIDLGLTEGSVPSEQFAVEVVHYDELVAVATPDHPLCKKRKVFAADLANVPFICRERGSGSREVIEAALSERGLNLVPAMALGSTEAIKNAVAAGLGVAILSRLTVELELSAERLALVELRDLSLRRALYMVQLRDKHRSPAVEAFVAMLRSALGAQPEASAARVASEETKAEARGSAREQNPKKETP